jgi:Transcriptional regulator, AbiEi antitoxin
MDGWQALADEHGIVSASAAVSAGVTTRDLRVLRQSGALIQLDRGWYALGGAVGDLSLTPWERRRRIHALRARAVIRARDGRVSASHHTALVLRDLPTFAADLRQVHVTRTDDGQFRRRAGLTTHARPAGLSGADGIVDVGSAIMGTGRINGHMAGLIAADAALHRRMVTVAALRAAAEDLVGPASAQARRVAQLADGRAESPGETRLREALRLMGLRVTPQFVLEDGPFHAIVDFLLDDVGVIIEFDGFVKYGRVAPLDTAPTPAEVVFAEKIREDQIRALDFVVVRVTWRDLEDLPLLRRRIEAAITLADRCRSA